MIYQKFARDVYFDDQDSGTRFLIGFQRFVGRFENAEKQMLEIFRLVFHPFVRDISQISIHNIQLRVPSYLFFPLVERWKFE